MLLHLRLMKYKGNRYTVYVSVTSCVLIVFLKTFGINAHISVRKKLKRPTNVQKVNIKKSILNISASLTHLKSKLNKRFFGLKITFLKIFLCFSRYISI